MRTYFFETEQWVGAGLDETFAFFADAENLEAITPPFLHFRVLTQLPITMGEGVLIDYRLRLHGMPARWVTRIEEWSPGQGFVDRQLSGPYPHWVHRHRFEAGRGGTWVRDRVDYALAFDPLSRPVHAFYVRPTIQRIFAYRRGAIAHLLGEGRGTG